MSVVAELTLPGGAFPFESAVDADDVTLRIERVVPFGSTTVVVRVRGPDHRSAATALRSAASVTRSQVVEQLEDSTLVHARCEDWTDGLFRSVTDCGGTVLDAVREERWRVQVRFPDRETLSAFYDAAHDDVELGRINAESSVDPEGTADLSEPQAEALRTAFRRGYFEVPREAGVEDVAAELGISEQAVSERLRRGIANLAEQTLPDGEPES